MNHNDKLTLIFMDAENDNQRAADLSNMLKNYKTKPENDGPADYLRYNQTPPTIQWVIKHSGGLIKDGRQASYVLLGFAAAAAVIAFYLLFGGSFGASEDKAARDQMLKIHPELMVDFKR